MSNFDDYDFEIETLAEEIIAYDTLPDELDADEMVQIIKYYYEKCKAREEEKKSFKMASKLILDGMNKEIEELKKENEELKKKYAADQAKKDKGCIL